MGVVSFVSGSNTLRVHYSQQSSIGGNKSTLTIERVTVQRDIDYAWPGNYFADGKVLVDGKAVAVYSLAMSDGQFALYPIGEEHSISVPSATVEVDQPEGQRKDIKISLSGNAYDSFMVWRKEETFAFKNETQMVEVEAIPQHTVTANSGKFTLTINRTASESGKGIGSVEVGGNVFYGDVLHITVAPKAGHAIQSITVNGELHEPEFDITVGGSVEIFVATSAIGAVRIDGGLYIPYIDSGTEYEQFIPHGDNGAEWEIFG